MAVVTYEVQCRIIHPDTKQPLIAYDAEYEPYNVVIEKSNSVNKPDNLVGAITWPLSGRTGVEQNILVEALDTSVGHAMRGYEHNYRFLDALMNSQAIVTQVQQILLFQNEIDDIIKRTEEDIKLRDDVARQIKRDHNGALLDYTTGTVAGDYYSHSPVQGTITFTGCKSSSRENTPTFGDSYRFAHSAQCDENVRLFRQYVTKIQSSNTLKTSRQNSMVAQQNSLIRSIQQHVHQAELNFMADRAAISDNPLYSALYLFKGTKQTYSREYKMVNFQRISTSGSSFVDVPERNFQLSILQDTFDIVRGNFWNTTSTHDSQPSAQKAAAYLGKSVGMENVRVIKIVPLDTKVVIEGQN
jgi:hypothetical protein